MRHRTTQREPLLTTPVPEMPWQRVDTDIFTWEKKTYPVVVDYFCRYTEVAYLNVARASTVIAKNIFGRHGVPEVECQTMGHSMPVHTSRTLLVNTTSLI